MELDTKRRTSGVVLVCGLIAGCAAAAPQRREFSLPAAVIRGEPALPGVERTTREPAGLEMQGPKPVEFYLRLALERNPEVHAARASVAAQAQVIPQVTALKDPMISSTFWPITERSPQTAMGRMPYGLMVSQEVPWFGKLRAQGEVAEQELEMALARLARAEQQVAEAVRLAYYELYFNQRAIDITEENRRLLEDLLQIADARYRTGETSQQDILRAQVELDRVDNRLIALRQSVEEVQADLARLLRAGADARPEAMTQIAGSFLPAEVGRLYDLALQCRPELREQTAAIVREQSNEKLARLGYYPDVTFGFGWDVMTTNRALAPTADGMDNFGFTVGFNIPIWWERLRAGVDEAQQRVIESAHRYDASRDDTFRLVRRLLALAQALEEQSVLFRKSILPHAEQTLQVSIADYRVGQVSFLQLIDNWMQLLAFQVQLALLEANREQALASLERAVGCALAESESEPDGPPVIGPDL